MSENPTTKLIWVECPDCLDANRAARRRCKAKGGMCKGKGIVQKWVPIRRDEHPEADTDRPSDLEQEQTG